MSKELLKATDGSASQTAEEIIRQRIAAAEQHQREVRIQQAEQRKIREAEDQAMFDRQLNDLLSELEQVTSLALIRLAEHDYQNGELLTVATSYTSHRGFFRSYDAINGRELATWRLYDAPYDSEIRLSSRGELIAIERPRNWERSRFLINKRRAYNYGTMPIVINPQAYFRGSERRLEDLRQVIKSIAELAS